MNTPTLETDRLLLRKFTSEDVEDMFVIYSDKEVNTFLPWFVAQSIEETRNYLANNILPEYTKEIAYSYAIVYKGTNQVVGYVHLSGIDTEKRCGELGYGLRRDHWNRGIVTEAAGAVLSELRDNGFKYVIATHDVNNAGSGAVMEKIGMTYQYSYDEMWQPKNFKVTFKLYRIDFE